MVKKDSPIETNLERVVFYTTQERKKAILRYKKEQGLSSISEAVDSIVSEALTAKYNDATLVLTAIEELDKKAARASGLTHVLIEAFLAFVRLYLAHTPEIPNDLKASAANLSAERFDKFTSSLESVLADRHSLTLPLLLEAFYRDSQNDE